MAPNSPIYLMAGHLGDSQFELHSKSITGLTLRIPTSNNITAVMAILENKANSEFDKSISDATAEELQSIAQRWTTVNNPLTHVNFIIWKNEQPLGIAGMGWIGPVGNDGEEEYQSQRAGAAGVMLQPFARGKGYAYEALRMVIDYGLCELDLVEVRVGTQSANVPMRKLMENKFGLQPDITVDSVDKFGNDLLWTLKRQEWLRSNKYLGSLVL